ncbi:MAG: phage terminase large subunit [Rickettsiales bacterium]|nr:phage terminase large subunit [Rickettsiales bacterium]
MMLTEQEYEVLLSSDLSSFIQQCFMTVSAGAHYLHNWHIDLIASKLEQCRIGEIKRLIINIPPRNLKSICTSVSFPAWLLAHEPNAQIICASYSQELSHKHALDTRQVMSSDWYQGLFSTRLDRRKNSIDEFMTTKGGVRLATSVGGTLTGRGGDYVIIDDPLKPSEAISESQRTAVNEWYNGTLYSRLNDKQEGCIIIIMQRLHEDDLVGHVLQQEEWEVVSLPAIADGPETHRYHSIFGTHQMIREPGDLLHPVRESQAVLDRHRAILGEYHFAGQYQQQPAPLGGGMIKTDWFQCYDQDALPDFDHIVQSWDTANKATELADYSVCTVWGIKGQQYYLLDVFREKLDFPELRKAVMVQWSKWSPHTILIEDKASGTQLIQDITKDVRCVRAVKPTDDKIMRMHSQSALIESGAVYIPEQASWLASFLHELSIFPNGRHDDQVDSVSQFLIWAQGRHKRVMPRAWIV